MTTASQLDQAELCGLTVDLSARYPSTSRAALKGVAFHARSDQGGPVPLHESVLTDEERDEIGTWQMPSADLHGEALTEAPWGLSSDGHYISVRRDGRRYLSADGEHMPIMVAGTADMYWHDAATDRIIVGDIKTGQQYVSPLSLQVVSAAFAFASLYTAREIQCGIWWAREGRWDWSAVVDVDSEQAATLFARVKRAATNPPVATVGTHCGDCYQRAHCPAWMLPANQAVTDLAPLAEGGALSAENALKAHLLLQAMGKMVDIGRDTLKAWLRENGPVDVGDGKQLLIEQRTGREYVDLGAIKAEGLTRFVRRTKPSETIAVRRIEK